MSTNDVLDMLLEQAGRLFVDRVTPELLRSAEAGKWPSTLWKELGEFGLPHAMLQVGGDGLTYSNCGALFNLIGASSLPLPLGETMLANHCAALAGLEPPEGSASLLPNTLDVGDEDVSGDAGIVSQADRLAFVLGTADAAGKSKLVVLSPHDASQTPENSISRIGSARLRFDRVKPVALLDWPETLPSACELGAMLRASQMAGAMRRLLELSVEYANTRRQFGRSIGRFQAIQQSLAELAGEAAACAVAADMAWSALDRGPVGAAAMTAKIRAGIAARKATAIAHQVHGAIGFTDEYHLHYHSRRLWQWRQEFGSETVWAQRLGRAFLGSGDAWSFLIDIGNLSPARSVS